MHSLLTHPESTYSDLVDFGMNIPGFGNSNTKI